MSSSLAIVEKRPSPFPGGGCAGGVLFHLLDWHRRLARKRRLFSPRRPSCSAPPHPAQTLVPASGPATAAQIAARGSTSAARKVRRQEGQVRR